MDSGNNRKDNSCCPMIAAIQSVKRGKFRLARRYAIMSLRLIMRYDAGMKTRIALAVSLLLIGAGADLATAAPALATPSCGSGYICFYDATDGSTLLAKVAASSYVKSYCYVGSSGKIPAGTSYIKNDSSSAFVVSTATNCGPTTGPIYANSYGAMNSTYSNKLKSIYKS